MKTFTYRFISSINQISREQWQQLFADDYPFTRHEFLASLESSGCTTATTGWQVSHLLIAEQQTPDQIVAAMPCYIKSHSYGEYIFDWSWADAYHQHGLRYYPKILCAIPYTPATGNRLAILADYEKQRTDIISCINQGLMDLAEQINASNWQCLFLPQTLSEQLSKQHWLQRIDVQYHWFNKQYRHFDDFLAALTSRKRKSLRKERAQIEQADIQLKVIEGSEITTSIWTQFFRFYQLTYQKRSRNLGYLNLEFFTTIGQLMPEQMMMVVAYHETEMIAAALYFKSNQTLYGRYWGGSDPAQFLHFECCYYQGIDYAIHHGLQRFDAGAQGEHKLQRGFEPVITYANYHILHPQFSLAIKDYLNKEQQHIKQYIEDAKQKLPFRNPV